MRRPLKIPFWERVKFIIRAQKITQREFAARIKLKYSTMKFWMCYGLSPDADTACDIADALGVPVEYLVKGKRISKRKKGWLSKIPEI